MQQKNKAITTICSGYGFLAERKGFEPLWLLTKRFSRPPRYDRFDTSPNIADPVNPTSPRANAPTHPCTHKPMYFGRLVYYITGKEKCQHKVAACLHEKQKRLRTHSRRRFMYCTMRSFIRLPLLHPRCRQRRILRRLYTRPLHSPT